MFGFGVVVLLLLFSSHSLAAGLTADFFLCSTIGCLISSARRLDKAGWFDVDTEFSC